MGWVTALMSFGETQKNKTPDEVVLLSNLQGKLHLQGSKSLGRAVEDSTPPFHVHEYTRVCTRTHTHTHTHTHSPGDGELMNALLK